jgi:hypothetical protein
MVLSGLLLVALVSLCLGLTLPSAGFLIASLVVCVVAAFLLVRARVCLSAAGLPSKSPLRGPAVATQTVTSSTHPGRAEEPPAAADAGADPATVWVVDGSPDYHAGHDCPALTGQDLVDIPLSQAVEDGFAPCRICRIPPTDEAGATTAGRGTTGRAAGQSSGRRSSTSRSARRSRMVSSSAACVRPGVPHRRARMC